MKRRMGLQRRFLWGFAALFALTFAGTLGYTLIEGWTVSDALYMTVITLSTVGYKEVHPLSTEGRIFSIALIVSGIGIMFYTLTTIAEYFIEGGMEGVFWRQRMKNKISRLRNHFIICGYGRMGQEVAHIFTQNNIPFVIIDSDEYAIMQAKEDGYLCIMGNASNDDILREAGINYARGLIATTGNDADNIFIVLSARVLNPNLFIVARACTEDAEEKLKHAGADRVIFPLRLGGRRMAMLALRPLVVDFIDTMLHRRGDELGLELEDIQITQNSPLVKKTVKEVEKYTGGAIILAIRKEDGRFIAKPDDDTMVESGDILVIMGTRDQLKTIESE
ncbi:MAG: potassium channel family protein [Candidatus Methanospirareceae archaeon]